MAGAHIPHEIDHIQRVRSWGVFCGDRKLVLSDGQDTDPNPGDLAEQNPPGCFKVLPSANGGDACLRAHLQRMVHPSGPVIQDMVIRQTERIDARVLNAVDAGRGFAEDRTGFEDGGWALNERAFQVGNDQVGLLELREEIIEEAASVALFEERPIVPDRTKVCADEESGHMKENAES
jgi:hypothetical protein